VREELRKEWEPMGVLPGREVAGRVIAGAMVFFSVALASFPACGESAQEEIVIGLIPEMNIFEQRMRYVHLADYLTERCGVRVRLATLIRYGNIIENFTAARLDGAFFGSFTGTLAIQRLNVEPIARPLWVDGKSTYHGHIFVRKDSGIRTVEDMRGKRMAFVERATTAGYIFPLAYLREHGVSDLDAFFGEYFFTGSHDAAIRAVLRGEADVGAAKNTIMEHVMQESPEAARELLILTESPPVPSNGLLVRRTLGEDARRKLKEALLNMEQDPGGKEVLRRFGAIRFIETRVEDYEPVFNAARKAGIEMSTYEYTNVEP
jgi:phosphonate transport system substrate-binding protein